MPRPRFARRRLLSGFATLALLGTAALGFAPAVSPAQAQDAAAPADAEAVTYHVRILGDPDAPVHIEEFSSFTCGHCAHFHNDTLPVLKEKYIDTGKANLTLVDFPLDDIALAVSLVTRCAPEPMYYKLVGIYFEDQQAWLKRDPLPSILGIARLGGLSEEQLNACLSSDSLFEEIRTHAAEAQERYDITGTPTFAINGVRHRGDYSVESMSAVIDAALALAEGEASGDETDAGSDSGAESEADSGAEGN